MGTQKVKPIKTQEQRKNFLYHLLTDIKALDYMVAHDMLEKGIQRIGAEQEFSLVTKNFRPSPNSLKILEELKDSQFTTELGLFNMEHNVNPYVLKDNCFQLMESHLQNAMQKAHTAAANVDDTKIIMVGILPTFRKKDLVIKNLTPKTRYLALNKVLKDIRGDEFRMIIRGIDELTIKSHSILYEAVNTSFQVHLQIPLQEIITKYNWAQAISGPVLSVMTNSPLLLGRELRSETRIAVFQQSIDTRNTSYHLREQKSRVSFGNEWIKNSITDVYKDDISRHTAIMTSDFDDDSLQMLERGEIPKLKALNLHNSTLYKWNRLCYGITEGKPHLRIENRYIPAGPSIKDEIANAVFWVGLMQGMPEKYKEIWQHMPFNDARGNFINASRTGIDTYFNWFGEGISARKLLIEQLIPMAKEGLKNTGIDAESINYYLEIIEKRVKTNCTGSKWIIRNYRALKKELTRDESNVLITHGMYNRQITGKPVHEWSAIRVEDGVHIAKKYDTLRKVMTTELFVAHKADPIDLVQNIMKWKNIHHMPIVNKRNKLIGVVTNELIENAQRTNTKGDLISVNDIMKSTIVTVDPETTLNEAKEIMEKSNVDCLPIIENGELIGIFTKNDLKRVIKKKHIND